MLHASIEILKMKGIKMFCEKIAEICYLAAQQNSNDYNVFVEMSGHISEIRVRVYYGGWDSNKDEIRMGFSYYGDLRDNFYDEAFLTQIKLNMIKAHRLYRKHGIKFNPFEKY